MRLRGDAAGYLSRVDDEWTPWCCQVLFEERTEHGVAVDLIAMEPCPFADADLPVGMPFTIQLLGDGGREQLIDEWVDESKLVTLRLMRIAGHQWLYASEHGRYLVMQLNPE